MSESAIPHIDNIETATPTLAADAFPTSLGTTTALSESQGSSIQGAEFDKSLTDMLSNLGDPAANTNPSIQIVSGQSLEEALADAIPGLDPTTVNPPDLQTQTSVDASDPAVITPPDPLDKESSLNPPTLSALGEIDRAESLSELFQSAGDGFEDLSDTFESLSNDADPNGKVFKAVSDRFDSLSDSFERLAGAFLDLDDTSETGEVGSVSNDAEAEVNTDKVAIAEADAEAEVEADKVAIAEVEAEAEVDVDKVAIAEAEAEVEADKSDKAGKLADDIDTTNIGFGLNNVTGDDSNAGFGFNNALDPDFDFDALKVNVDQVSKGLQFLVQQLEAAFESDDSALTTEMLTNVPK